MQSFYCSNVYVKGPKEVIDRMLAAARRNIGDSIPVDLNLSDLLDEECWKDSQVLEKQRAFLANEEDAYDEKMYELAEVSGNGTDSTVLIRPSEEAYYYEWLSKIRLS